MRQVEYLELMGIPVWQLRESVAKPSSLFNGVVIKISTNEGAPLGLFFTDKQLSLDEEALFKKIANALSDNVYMTVYDQQLVSGSETIQFVVCFGECEALDALLIQQTNAEVIRAPELRCLAENPELKKILWHQLKSFKYLFVV